jgi:hypothetical protein
VVPNLYKRLLEHVLGHFLAGYNIADYSKKFVGIVVIKVFESLFVFRLQTFYQFLLGYYIPFGLVQWVKTVAYRRGGSLILSENYI